MHVIVNVYRQLLVGLDDVKFFAVSALISYLVAILVTPTLVQMYGLPGAAFALSLSVFLSGLAIPFRLASKFHSSIPFSLWVRIAACLSGIIVTGLIFSHLEEFSVPGFLARVLYIALLTPLLWRLLPGDQKRMILDVVRRFRA